MLKILQPTTKEQLEPFGLWIDPPSKSTNNINQPNSTKPSVTEEEYKQITDFLNQPGWPWSWFATTPNQLRTTNYTVTKTPDSERKKQPWKFWRPKYNLVLTPNSQAQTSNPKQPTIGCQIQLDNSDKTKPKINYGSFITTTQNPTTTSKSPDVNAELFKPLENKNLFFLLLNHYLKEANLKPLADVKSLFKLSDKALLDDLAKHFDLTEHDTISKKKLKNFLDSMKQAQGSSSNANIIEPLKSTVAHFKKHQEEKEKWGPYGLWLNEDAIEQLEKLRKEPDEFWESHNNRIGHHVKNHSDYSTEEQTNYGFNNLTIMRVEDESKPSTNSKKNYKLRVNGNSLGKNGSFGAPKYSRNLNFDNPNDLNTPLLVNKRIKHATKDGEQDSIQETAILRQRKQLDSQVSTPKKPQHKGKKSYTSKVNLFIPHFPGQTLFELIDSGMQGIPPEERRRLIIKLLQQVLSLHEDNIIHRDIKPDNAIYDPKERAVTVFDFGLSRYIEDARKNPDCGSPATTAPEAWRREINDFFSDTFSACMTALASIGVAKEPTQTQLNDGWPYRLYIEQKPNLRELAANLGIVGPQSEQFAQEILTILIEGTSHDRDKRQSLAKIIKILTDIENKAAEQAAEIWVNHFCSMMPNDSLSETYGIPSKLAADAIKWQKEAQNKSSKLSDKWQNCQFKIKKALQEAQKSENKPEQRFCEQALNYRSTIAVVQISDEELLKNLQFITNFVTTLQKSCVTEIYLVADDLKTTKYDKLIEELWKAGISQIKIGNHVAIHGREQSPDQEFLIFNDTPNNPIAIFKPKQPTTLSPLPITVQPNFTPELYSWRIQFKRYVQQDIDTLNSKDKLAKYLRAFLELMDQYSNKEIGASKLIKKFKLPNTQAGIKLAEKIAAILDKTTSKNSNACPSKVVALFKGIQNELDESSAKIWVKHFCDSIGLNDNNNTAIEQPTPSYLSSEFISQIKRHQTSNAQNKWQKCKSFIEETLKTNLQAKHMSKLEKEFYKQTLNYQHTLAILQTNNTKMWGNEDTVTTFIKTLQENCVTSIYLIASSTDTQYPEKLTLALQQAGISSKCINHDNIDKHSQKTNEEILMFNDTSNEPIIILKSEQSGAQPLIQITVQPGLNLKTYSQIIKLQKGLQNYLNNPPLANNNKQLFFAPQHLPHHLNETKIVERYLKLIDCCKTDAEFQQLMRAFANDHRLGNILRQRVAAQFGLTWEQCITTLSGENNAEYKFPDQTSQQIHSIVRHPETNIGSEQNLTELCEQQQPKPEQTKTLQSTPENDFLKLLICGL